VVGGFVGGGIPGAIAGGIGSFGKKKGGGGQPIPRFAPGNVNPDRLTKKQRRDLGQLASGPCPRGTIMGSGGCVSPSSPRGSAEAGGAVVMGRFGAGYVPDQEMVLTRDCLPGDVLGRDNICYPKASLKNNERKYPRGTRPLGTPGEMAALRKAASFGRRMETTIKRMQKIGVIKKPGRGRSSSRRAAPRQLAPGPSIINVE